MSHSLRAIVLLVASMAGGLAGAEAQRLASPSWMGKEPLVIVGNWDTMPIFRRRVGGDPVWQQEDYAREHTEETVKRLKEMGVTMAVTHFFKGFGLEAEKEHQVQARKLAVLCKKHGLRVGFYVGSTICFETFLSECPEAAEWFAPDFLGRQVVYGDQTFRKRVYFMHPGYRAYIKRVLRLAVQDFQADLIHFDNTSLQAQSPIFFHPLAVQDFRKFLGNKYSAAQLRERFGHAEVAFLEPPEVDRPLSTISDPMFQEWADFRCQQLTEYYAEMERFIRGLNPEVAVECNPHSGISGENTVWTQGIDYPRLLSHMDVVWTEEGNEAGVTDQGILVSKIRTYKMAALLNNSIFTYTGGRKGSELAMAEAMAYNRQNLGMVGGPLAAYDLPEIQRRYIRFFHKNFDKYAAVNSLADVAVLHSYASMAYNNDLPWQSAMLVEQSLIQDQIPFDIIFDAQLADLAKYRVLVLADQECLSDAQMDQIRAFAARGGAVLATEHTSLFNEFRQRRRNFGLKDLLGIDAPEWRGGREAEESLSAPPVRSQTGRGRIVYLPSVKPATPKPAASAMRSSYWKLPHNFAEIMAELRWAAGEPLTLEIKAPATVTAELAEQKAANRWLIHFVNYDAQRSPMVPNIEVTLRVPPGKQIAQVSILSPDEASRITVPWRAAASRAAFELPRLRTYSMAVIEWR